MRKININILQVFILLFYTTAFVGCEKEESPEDSANQINTAERNDGEIAYITDNDGISITLKENTILRRVGHYTYDHDIIMNIEEEEISEDIIRYFNPLNPSDFFEVEIINDLEDGRFDISVTSSKNQRFNFTGEIYDETALQQKRGGGKAIKRLVDLLIPIFHEISRDRLSEEDGSGSGGASSCAQTAVNTCGQGNVESVNYEDGWFTDSCTFTCK
ncbi:MAG: hypothetical protein ACQESK_10225 [Bacteroidota bacterium]